MSDTTVRLKIKIEGSDSLKEVEMSADELAKAFVSVKDKVHELNEKLLNVNQISQAFEQIGAVVQSLQSVMHDLTDTYAVQAQAEARLEQMMRNTMDATEDEIQSIKDLAAEQQKLGVIGDEVILSGAQELATYMQRKESLEALIPMMDDMIAQQYGFNASAESAVSVAQMLGKVFAGETGALKRLGYTFDEAQEAVLKYGTEEEKVAMLTEVVGQIVDGTNAKLAATPYGQIAKFRNDLGDIKEHLGKMVAPAMNAVDTISKLTIAIAGIGKGVSAIKGVTVAIKAMATSAKAAKTATQGLNAAMKANVIIAVALAVALLAAGLVKLARNSRNAVGNMEELKAANEAYKDAVGNAKAEIDTEIAALKNLIDQGKDTTEAVKHLNEAYGESFGYHKTAVEWYDTLTQKSLTYCKQLGYEAKAKKLSAEIGALIVQRDAEKEKLDAMPKTYTRHEYDDMGNELPGTDFTDANKAWERQNKVVTDLDNKINSLTADMNTAWGEAANAAKELDATVDDGAEAVAWQKMNYEDLGKAITAQTDKLKKYSDGSAAEAKAEKATLQAMQIRYQQLGEDLGLVTKKVKDLGDEIRRTPTELVPTFQPIAPASIDKPKETYDPAPAQLNNVQTLAHYNQALAELEEKRLHASKEELPVIDGQIALVQQLKDEFEGIHKINLGEALSKSWGGLKGIGNSIRDIKSALTETDNAWDALTQTVDGFISLFQSLSQITEIINTITTATQTMQGVRDAATRKELANAAIEVSANTAKAGSGAASSVASIPYVGPVLAIAAMGSVLAALATLPKFANGGLVYGPTLGLMGEYGGARSNPEVIAPLNRLRAILGEGGGGRTEVEFHIKGRELVGILNKQNNIYQRSN